MSHNPDIFMQRAIDLAYLGEGRTTPNPKVGCVVEYNGKIIGEGYHHKAGEPHAEVNALNSVKDKNLLSESNVYVTLEPCSHFGKTPPCSDLLISQNVKKVFVGSKDPNPKVDGSGIEKLKNAGIEVIEGVLEKECSKLNRDFFSRFRYSRPFIALKWAESADFFIDPRNDINTEGQVRVSNFESSVLTHRWRNEFDAILIGNKTAGIDNPSLTTRKWHGKNPLRIILDRTLKLSSSLEVFNDGLETLVLNEIVEKKKGFTQFLKLNFNSFKEDFVTTLNKFEINSLLVEGGGQTLQRLIDLDLWDQARVYQNNEKFYNGTPSPKFNRVPSEHLSIGNNKLYIFER
ncbi:MAG: bifunctional diaminohydroxyphosphoribosylaminopyrimidine deaminase/5-amino-6-(5-phosphoribosylamino)uracil reductase RibD [Schleiferiaceae bacterium]|nr:bifunctional diaminohydroxyphosphoribosylaminopyrimidine deaminase/5-amino-6-(5-phosphoribosylamino)uracil reductase RibD [Schleiferiaceae bacterium]